MARLHFPKQAVARTLLCAVALSWAATVNAAEDIRLPDIGDSSGAVLSPEQERSIGQEVMRHVRLSFELVDDPEVKEYIRGLGYRLVAHSDARNQEFTFFVLDAADINAFAAPGGFVGINSGLILATESESELASVLAHEIAHVTQRHLARAYETQQKLALPALAGIVAAILLGSQNSDLGQAALAASQAGSVQAQLNFTRSNEKEADDIGIRILASAGFNPRAMPAFFENLQYSSRFYTRPPEFLSTHPVTASRIAESRGRAETYSYRQVKDSFQYHLVREKLRVRMENDHKQAVTRFREALESGQYRNENATRYGYALALLQNGQYDAARNQMAQLQQKNPERIAYLIGRARIELGAGRHREALEIYQDALKLYPRNHPLTIRYAEALLASGNPEKARQVLHAHIRHRTPEADTYKLLAVVEGEAGHPVEAHQSMAEYHYLNGRTQAAIEQLDIALRHEDTDFYETSKIQARRGELQEQARLEAQR